MLRYLSLSLFTAGVTLLTAGLVLSGGINPVHAAPLCAEGFFSATGEEPCAAAPAGYYTAGTGSLVPGAAPAGTFVSNPRRCAVSAGPSIQQRFRDRRANPVWQTARRWRHRADRPVQLPDHRHQ